MGPTFRGDSEYSILTTGDCVVGDHVRFERAIFSGSFRNATLTGFELITAVITADSYGAEKQQHTFTLTTEDGLMSRIKGRNLYRHGVWRKPWPDEAAREIEQLNKHARGDRARESRARRREFEGMNYA